MRFTEFISEAGSPAQQAAIAIAMKKAGKKPKDVAEAGITGSSRSAEAIAKQKEWNSSSASDSKQDTKTFSYQGYTINFTPDKLNIYLGGDLVFSRKGNFADPTKKQLVAARLSIGKIIDDKRREALIHSVIQKNKGMQGVAEGSLNEFAPDGFNGGDDDDEGFSPEIAKMAQDDGFTKGAGLADGATLERAMAINHWHSTHGGMYKQHFAKGFKAGRMDKIRHNNKQYNLNLKLMKDGSIRHGEQGVAEGENWSKYNHKRVGGMSKKSVSSYRRSHPGSKIQTAVTTKPSKLKKGSKAAKRRASFCARMRGMKKHRTSAKTAHDPNSNINKSLRRWHCESIEELQELVMIAEQFIRNKKNEL